MSIEAPQVATLSISAIIDGKSTGFENIQEKFDALAELWDEQNGFRAVQDYNHPTYQQIVGMGPAAVPLLIPQPLKPVATYRPGALGRDSPTNGTRSGES